MDSTGLQGERDMADSLLPGLSPCPCILMNALTHLSSPPVFGFILILHMAGNNTVSKSSKFIPSHLQPWEHICSSDLNKVLFWSWGQPLDQSLLSGRCISRLSRPRIHTYPHQRLYPQGRRTHFWDCKVRRTFPGMQTV